MEVRGPAERARNLTLSHLFDGIKLGVLFGPFGAILGVYAMDLIVSKIIDSSS